MMKTRKRILLTIATVLFVVLGVTDSYGQTPEKKKDMSKMMQEPHHVLAMAFKKNMQNFALILREQIERDGVVDAEFARSAVAEIKRSFDELEKHQQAHHRTMTEEMRVKMKDKMAEMQSKHPKIREAIGVLETDVQSAKPDPKRMLADINEILQHLEMMKSEMPRSATSNSKH